MPLTEKLKLYIEIKVNFTSEKTFKPDRMKENYAAQTPAQARPRGVSMKTKLLWAKIGLAICIIVLIVARSIGH